MREPGSKRGGAIPPIELPRLAAELVEALPFAVLITNPDGQVLTANRRGHDVFGYDPAEIRRLALPDLIPDLAAQMEAVLGPLGRPSPEDLARFGSIHWGRDRHGARFPVDVDLSPLQNGGQELVAVTIKDVSGWEDHSRKLFHPRVASRILRSLDLAVVGLAPDGTILSWNQAAERLYRFTETEAVGQTTGMLTHDPDADDIAWNLSRVLDGDAPAPFLVNHRTKDDDPLPVLVAMAAIRDEEGEAIGASLALTPAQPIAGALGSHDLDPAHVTVLAGLLEPALAGHPASASFREACRRIREAVGADLCVVMRRRAGSLRLAVEAGDGIDEAWVGHDASEPGTNDQARRALAQERPVVVEDRVQGQRFGGPGLPSDVGVQSGITAPIPLPDGVWGVLAVHWTSPRQIQAADVTLLETAATLLGTILELETKPRPSDNGEERGGLAPLPSFHQLAAHDLREPLRMVTGYLGLLERRAGNDLSDAARSYLWAASDGADRMRDQLDGLRRLSQPAGPDVHKEPTDLSGWLVRALKTLERSIEEHGAEVTYDPMPTALADGPLIEEVFQNLISNAIHYVPKDRTPRVHIGAERIDDTWMIRIEDNGVGIPEEQREAVFIPFRRLHSRAEAAGEGLGLSICQLILHTHRSRIWVEDSELDGSALCFTLVAADADGSDRGEATASSVGPALA